MKSLNKTALWAVIWVAAMAVPLIIRGAIANYTQDYYLTVLGLYLVIVAISTVSTMLGIQRDERSHRYEGLTPEQEKPNIKFEFSGWLFTNAIMTIGLWVLGFVTGTV